MAIVSEQTTEIDTHYDEKEDNQIRESWSINSLCKIYSRCKQKWFDGTIIQMEDINNNEWLTVKYGIKRKKIQRHCSDIKPIPLNHASLFEEGSVVQIYSRNKWCNGEVIGIYNDAEGEWLTIKYSEKGCVKICDVQRYCGEIKLVLNVKHLKEMNIESVTSLRSIWKTHRKAMEEWLEKENADNITPPWTLLSSNNALYRTNKYSNLVKVNDYEFIVAPNQSFEEPIENNGIYKYNVMDDEWILLVQYPPQFVADSHSIWMDNGCIYIYYYLGAVAKIYIETKTLEWFQPKDDDDYKNEGDTAIFKDGALMFVKESKIHIFWSKDSATHHVYDETIKELSVLESFDFKESKGRISYGMIHNTKNKYILLFGGFKGTGLGRTDEIWQYVLEDKRWNKLDVTMPHEMQSFGCVIDLNCEYVLIFGGNDSNGFKQHIHILNLYTMKWSKSKILCPFKAVGTGSVVIMKSPHDHDVQRVHILQGNYRHFTVLLSDILP